MRPRGVPPARPGHGPGVRLAPGNAAPVSTSAAGRRERPRRPAGRAGPRRPGSTVSSRPPWAAAMTGTPRMNGSTATRPSGSAHRDGTTAAQAADSSRSTPAGPCQPGERDVGPEARGRRPAPQGPGRCGPSPTMRRRACGTPSRGRARRRRSRRATPFSRLSRPTKTSSGSAAGARANPGEGGGDGKVEDPVPNAVGGQRTPHPLAAGDDDARPVDRPPDSA